MVVGVPRNFRFRKWLETYCLIWNDKEIRMDNKPVYYKVF